MKGLKSIFKANETNPRNARAVAAILGNTLNDSALQQLNQSDGRNQSEQASYIASLSPFLRETYERGAAVVDGILTVPRENLTLAPEIEITRVQTAVERLTRITQNENKARELAPQLVEMGEIIAGKHSDGETRVKVFNWLYQTLEGKQELLEPKTGKKLNDAENDSYTQQFSEKWQEIRELSDSLAALEPPDQLPEYSFDELREHGTIFTYENETGDEILPETEIDGNEVEHLDKSEQDFNHASSSGFERIDLNTEVPKIPPNLSSRDFENLLQKTVNIDFQLEHGVPLRQILAPFRDYVKITRLDNELRLLEEEYQKVQTKQLKNENNEYFKFRFVATREEIRQLQDDKLELAQLRLQQEKLQIKIEADFSETLTPEKVKESISDQGNQSFAPKNTVIELSDEERELQKLVLKEKSTGRQIVTLSENIEKHEQSFHPISEISTIPIPVARQKELDEKVLLLELPVPYLLKEKYPTQSPKERNELLENSNTFEIRSPAEYLFVRELAAKHFDNLRSSYIKNEYRRFDNLNLSETGDYRTGKKELQIHREQIFNLKTIEPSFTYKIEGSNHVIRAKSSERSVDGFNFINEYLHYQLKQPETRARRESPVYRQYAQQLESAKTPEELIQAAYLVRQENHQGVKAWKNSTNEERKSLVRPLSKNEMSLLFLEQAPRGFTTEMSILKYNFAHYSHAKHRMTEALEQGTLKPSPDANKLNASLENRLSRRQIGTAQKATRHFFESLKTENENLVIKNEFDHSAVYQKLPPHEKDWIYAKAQLQKENLEYKIAFDHLKNEKKQSTSLNLSNHNGITAGIRREFAIGTLWHQAAALTDQSKSSNIDFGSAQSNPKILQTVGALLHNQSEDNNLRVAEWLGAQKGEELKTAGEILHTFAKATREIENNQLTVTVKINKTARVSRTEYQDLFNAYFPPKIDNHLKYKVGENENFKLESSRREGQAALLKSWINETQKSIYQPSAPVKVFENEQTIAEEIEKIKIAQRECRHANEIIETVSLKIGDKVKKELNHKSKEFSQMDLQTGVKIALTAENAKNLSSLQKEILSIAQSKISIKDFEKFTFNSTRLEEGLSKINQSFEKIDPLRLENNQYILPSQKTEKNKTLQEQYELVQRDTESSMITDIGRQSFSSVPIEENSISLNEFILPEDLEKAHLESHRGARIALEPAQLDQPEINLRVLEKALDFADSLENAHQTSLRYGTNEEISQAFNSAQTKRDQLNKSLEIDKTIQTSKGQKPVSQVIYEQELARNERTIAREKISHIIESEGISIAELESKKANEIFSPEERTEIRLEAAERTRENLEPKELWAKRNNLSENLQQAALIVSDALEDAHETYHKAELSQKEVSRAFSVLDMSVARLKNERHNEQNAAKYSKFKSEFKRDLANLFEVQKDSDKPQFLTTLTKGLLINSLEKQNIQTAKIGLTSENLVEISRKISLAMNENITNQRIISPDHSTSIAIQENRRQHLTASLQNNQMLVKTRKIEHLR